MSKKIEPNITKFTDKDFRVVITKNGKKIRRCCKTLAEARKFKAFVKSNDCVHGDPNSAFDNQHGHPFAAKQRVKREAKLSGYFVKLMIVWTAISLVLGVWFVFFVLNGSKDVSAASPLPSAIEQPGNLSRDEVTRAETAIKESLPDDMIIAMGANHDETDLAHRLYVIADPTCSACRALEPALEKLTDVSITIIPAPILETGDRFMGGIACATDKLAAWKRAINEGVVTDGSCPGGADAHIRAYKFFRASGFKSTPTLISGDGRVHAGTMGGDPDKIRAWLAGK